MPKMDMQIDETEYSNQDAEKVLEIEREIKENIDNQDEDSDSVDNSRNLTCLGKVVGLDKTEDYDGTYVELEISPSCGEDTIIQEFKIPENPRDKKTELKRLFDWADVDVTNVRNLISEEVPLERYSVNDDWKVDVPPVKTAGNYAIYKGRRKLSSSDIIKRTKNGIQLQENVKEELINFGLIINIFLTVLAINALASAPLTVPLVELTGWEIASTFISLIYSLIGSLVTIATILSIASITIRRFREKFFPSPN